MWPAEGEVESCVRCACLACIRDVSKSSDGSGGRKEAMTEALLCHRCSFVSRPLPERNPASLRLSTMVKIDETKNSSSFPMLFLNRPGSEIDAPLCCEVLVIQRHCSSHPACAASPIILSTQRQDGPRSRYWKLLSAV